MNRATIDYGIDLGTTNSEIALFNGTAPEIIKNNEGTECTPSAVWIDSKGRVKVGKQAKQRLDDDAENAFCEFKLQMGNHTEYTFARSGRKAKPEELSAEVLKSLRADVQRLRGEELSAAVITVPAAFKLPQCDATNRSARLAGFQFSPLLQEPVAAAMAYGFDSKSDNVFWLVYDLGGGTFDAAVIQVRDGVIQVVNHGGDNHLGGKLLDWEIVEQLLIPAVKRKAPNVDLRRGNPKCLAAIAKLKLAAEEAKIRCSAEQTAEILLDLNVDGRTIDFDYELNKRDVERLAEPLILRSVNVCRRVLAEQNLGTDHVERVVLVGGPTMMPYLRQRLADKKDGLGIPLEFSVDPLTVVARGAAVFARTQRLEHVGPIVAKRGEYVIQLEYKPAGPDPEPLVGGKVIVSEGVSLAGHTIEFVNETMQPNWRSGQIGLSPEGGFMTNLSAQKGPENRFRIEVRDAAGTIVATNPDHLTYVIMVVNTEQPLIHTMGIGLANNEMVTYLKKGTPLPGRHRDIRVSAVILRAGQAKDVLRIPVYEGQNQLADRNELIGTLEITGDQVKRDLPIGSEVEVTMEIDQSRLVRVKAYVPHLDEEFEHTLKLGGEKPEHNTMQKSFEREKERLKQMREKVKEIRDSQAEAALYRIDAERMVHDVEATLAAMSTDPDAGDKCQSRLLDLRLAIDEVEDRLEWPGLVAEADKEVERERKIIKDDDFKATQHERDQFAALEREIRRAIESRDPDLLRRKISEMDSLGFIILDRLPGFWVARFQRLEGMRSEMTNSSQADSYITQGQRAINNNDIPALKAACRQLVGLLPQDDPVKRELGGLM
jgi:molecular chaperone DnaK